jgi:transaldolase
MEKLAEILKDEPDDTQALVKLQRTLVEGIAQKFMPMYEASQGQCGYVSIQGDPFDETEESIAKYARFNTANLPNMTAKIPVVPGGIKAIKQLAPERVPINTTEIMTIRQALDIADIYDDVCAKIKDPAPMYYSVITGIFDQYLAKYVADKGIEIPSDYVWQAGLAVAKKTYAAVKERSSKIRFIGGGARGLHHFTEMVGADCVVTINWKGTADKLIEEDPAVVQRFASAIPRTVIDELSEKVDEFRRAYYIHGITEEEYEDYGPVVLFRSSFEEAWRNALAEIKKQRAEMK